ncbi:MAG: EthD domain-containing protein [Gammaproteobacteria bacterium]
MIKGYALAARKPGMPEDEFHRYWRDVHGPLALRISTLRRYVQAHKLPQPLPGFDHVPYDGAAELWFDTYADMQAMPANPEYLDGARADEPNFVDMSRLAFIATTEKVVIDSAPLTRDTR